MLWLRIVNAAKLANAHDFIMRLPEGKRKLNPHVHSFTG